MLWSHVITAFLILQFSSQAIADETFVATQSPNIQLEDDLVIGLDEDGIPLGQIVDVAVDSENHIYVLDAGAQTIHKFTDDGQHLASIGGPGEAPGQFNAPRCLAVGPDDRLYVSGTDLYIEVFDADGKPLDRIQRANINAAQSLAVDVNGDIFVVALNLFEQKMIHKYSGKSGELVRSFCDSYAVGQDVDTRIESVFAQGSIAVADGQLFFVQSYPHKIRIFDLAGTLIREFDARAAESKGPRIRLDSEGLQYQLPVSFSRTIVPLDGDRLLTILGLPYDGAGGIAYLDLYRQSDGARIVSIDNPPTFAIACRDNRGRLYSAETRDDVPVVVRYRLEGSSSVGATVLR